MSLNYTTFFNSEEYIKYRDKILAQEQTVPYIGELLEIIVSCCDVMAFWTSCGNIEETQRVCMTWVEMCSQIEELGFEKPDISKMLTGEHVKMVSDMIEGFTKK
jgi:hypothetical protein